MNYLDLNTLIKIHDDVIDDSGGLQGARDLGVLESVLQHIQNDIYYPTFEDKLAHLVYSINKSHAFNDGNKRASISAGVYFLLINDWEYEIVRHFMISMEHIAVDIAANHINKETLTMLMMFMLNTKIQAA